MNLIERIKKIFQHDEVCHWGPLINSLKQSQESNHHTVSCQIKGILCQLKEIHDNFEGLKADYKQSLDLLFLHAESTATLKQEITELKKQLRKIKKIPNTKTKDGNSSTTRSPTTK
jgi:archaellum component FlaC